MNRYRDSVLKLFRSDGKKYDFIREFERFRNDYCISKSNEAKRNK